MLLNTLYDLLRFDVRTLIGILFWGNLTSAILIYSYRTINKVDYDQEYVGILFISKLLEAIAYFLIFYRGIFPDIISVNIGNSLILFTFYLEGYLMLVLGKISSTKPYSILKCITIIAIILFNFAELFFKNSALRVGNASLFIFAILIIPSSILVFSKSTDKFVRIVGFFYMTFLFCLLPRTIYSFTHLNVYIFSNNIIQVLTFLSLVLIMIFNTPASLLIMKMNSGKIIEKMAITDNLTNLSNRHSFMEQAQKCFDQHKTTNTQLTILFFDIDFFKKVNDNYGHAFGDEVLIQFAKTIKKNIRHHDISCRYGGEEFLALLPFVNEEVGQLVGKRIMQDIEKLHFELHPDFKFTISIGICTGIPKEQDTLLSYIDIADQALYEAKNTGRNRIVVNKI